MGKKLLKTLLYSSLVFILFVLSNVSTPNAYATICTADQHQDSCYCGGNCAEGGQTGCCDNGTICTNVAGKPDCRPLPALQTPPSSGSCPTGQVRVLSPLDEAVSTCCPIGSCNGNTVTNYYYSTFVSGCGQQTYACPTNTTCGLGSSGYTCLPIPPTAIPTQPPIENPTSTSVPPTATPITNPNSTPTSTPPAARPTLIPTCDPVKTGDSAGKVDGLDFLWWRDEFLGVPTKTNKLSNCLVDDVIDIFDFNKLRDLSFFPRLSATAP